MGITCDAPLTYLTEDDNMEDVQMVAVVVRMSVDDANAHAQHKRFRDSEGRATLADNNRALADTVADKLIEEGYGR